MTGEDDDPTYRHASVEDGSRSDGLLLDMLAVDRLQPNRSDRTLE